VTQGEQFNGHEPATQHPGDRPNRFALLVKQTRTLAKILKVANF
jgi:hypothetical protein